LKNFALIGAAGYIAPRHMKAIKDTGNNLVAAYDPHDSVGILDDYFPEADFFTEIEQFDRHIEKAKREGVTIHYMSICSPSYLHDAHIRFGLRHGASIVCEKPIVLNSWNLNALVELEKDYPGKIYGILQMRLHYNAIALKKRIEADLTNKVYKIHLKYITSRGKWYHHSWKGDEEKSGGIVTNIGIHFFDFLIWIFGNVQSSIVEQYSRTGAVGILKLQKAEVKWELSLEYDALPKSSQSHGLRTYRSLEIEGEEFEFSDGFGNLHTRNYEYILNGKGFGILEMKKAIDVVSQIRINTEER